MELNKKRWLYILNGFVVLLFLGCGLAWSIFVVPIENTFGWTRSQTSLAFTMNILCFSVGSILAGTLSEKLSFSTLLKISAFMMFTGFMGVSLMKDVWHLYISYGVVVGTAIGMGYNCVVSSCPLWLPEKTATATGLLLMGYALSTAIFGPVLNALIGYIGIINTFRTLAVFTLTGIFLGSLNLRSPSVEETKLLPQNNKNTNKNDHSVTTKEMSKKPIFWLYYILTAFLAGIGLVIINHASPMLTEGLKASASFAALVISIISLCNGIGRFLWGMIYDLINSMSKCLLIIGSLFLVASVGMYFAIVGQSQILFIMSACCLLFSYGGNATTMPTIMRELFGHRTFSLNYSLLCTNAVFSSFFPSIIGSLQVMSEGYVIPLMLLVALTTFSLFTILIFIKSHKKYMKEFAK